LSILPSDLAVNAEDVRITGYLHDPWTGISTLIPVNWRLMFTGLIETTGTVVTLDGVAHHAGCACAQRSLANRRQHRRQRRLPHSARHGRAVALRRRPRRRAELGPYIIPQGSVTIDGISLTVAKVYGSHPDGSIRFDIAIIPHTYRMTNLHSLEAHSKVNIETDVLARYAANRMTHQQDWLTADYLLARGY
jgi:riboflavin synthase alpha subunit